LFLQRCGARFTPLDMGHVPLDIDVFTQDNSQTHKQGVARTYQGFDGFAPIAAYMAQEGWLLEVEHRQGCQHSQKDFIPFLQRVLHKARQLTTSSLLVRLDSAHDAYETCHELMAHDGVDFILKWNPRGQDKQLWHQRAFAHGTITRPREGKRVAVFNDPTPQKTHDGQRLAYRRVIRVIERSTDKKGQLLLEPDITLEGWWTTLSLPADTIIELYADHGTCEQYHSELKTDLDLERLPAADFAVNSLIMTCGTMAYNILRYIGQMGLVGPQAPVRHPAKRRRLKTVIQELMYLAARLIARSRRLVLRFSRHSGLNYQAFERLYYRLAYP